MDYGYGLTVNTAPSAEPLTLAEAKAHLRVDETAEDTMIEALITAARQHIEGICNRTLITTIWNLTLDAFPGEILLPRPPAVSISSIKYDDVEGTETTLSSSAYRLDATKYQPKITPAYGYTWPSTRGQTGAVRVIYTAGYGAAGSAVPGPLRSAIKLLLGHLYEHRESVIVGSIAVQMPDSVAALVAPYRVATEY